MERLTSRLDMALQGKTDINITTRALSKDFTMEITTSKMNGKALFGGMLPTCFTHKEWLPII